MFLMILKNKLNFIKITHTVQNKVNKITVIKLTNLKEELRINSNKNVFVTRIYLGQNGFSVVINKNAGDQIGIIYNVLDQTEKICKIFNKFILLANFVKDKKQMNKVKVNPEREIKKTKAVNDSSFNLKNYKNICSLNHYLFL